MLFAWIFGMQDFYPDVNMYNCTSAEASVRVEPSYGIGLLYLCLGVFYQICYIPCIIVMSRPPLIDMPCFKIMVYMGVIDVACLFICADLAGYWSLTGKKFCSHPALAYVLGNLAMGFWSATCFCCVFLAFNRSLDLTFPNKNTLFEGYRMIIWLTLPTIYSLYFIFFERPLLYDPESKTFFFDPKSVYSAALPMENATTIYANIPHSLNNVCVIISLVFFYFVICGSLIYKAHQSHLAKMSTMTRQIVLQSLVICGCHLVGCFLYVYTQYFPVPAVFTIISNMAWMGNHGLPGVIYLTMNATIRKRVFSLLGIYKVLGKPDPSSTARKCFVQAVPSKRTDEQS